mmetsp:Transcript_42863/g.84200  ORF Transcript_42863/g.84200 Transcript_42863/m.84200 type:complete len:269 (-) Transcript_42863:223-1029(-)
MNGRVGVHGTYDDFKLRLDSLSLLRGGADGAQTPHALTVQPKILAEALHESNVVSVIHELPQGPRVRGGVPSREALVGRVEERQVATGGADARDLCPLFGCRVLAGGVVGARVQEHAGSLRGSVQVLAQPREVERVCSPFVVSVLAHLDPGVPEDGDVVAPGRVGHVDVLVRTEFSEEFAEDAEAPRAAECLGHGHAPFCRWHAPRPVSEFTSQTAEFGVAPDGGVLVSVRAGNYQRLSLGNDRKDVWTAVVVSVGADAYVHAGRGGV